MTPTALGEAEYDGRSDPAATTARIPTTAKSTTVTLVTGKTGAVFGASRPW
ncbi:hypothetical protein P3102_37295 [Amycolatopsis sp. QT-25]|uniref:hypothetical protein n=1 Tax=Amycolatopsis sp. QT-25 TaxID=3034022 RepID=UPI0023ED3B11|nr:hypothetical protein [Amycolatopsis sp. QT-25]WET79600.1 hypothetical protein P3102_37295 [Amycolatopsis sp. QT-25]